MKRVAIVVALVACGGKAEPPPNKPVPVAAKPAAPSVKLATPAALAQAFLDALVSGDPARVHALYMTPEHVHALVTCDKDPVVELREHLAELDQTLAPAKLEYRGWIENGRSVLKAGTSRDGCTAKQDFELATGSVQFTIVTPTETKPDAKLIAIVRVGDGWRVWRMSRL